MNFLKTKSKFDNTSKDNKLDDPQENISPFLDNKNKNESKKIKNTLHTEKNNMKNNDNIYFNSAKENNKKLNNKKKSSSKIKLSNIVCSFLPFTLRPGISHSKF